jgi:type 1 glutamine amidotransferase
MAERQPIVDVYLVAAGQFHDIDFARRELLNLLAEHDNVRCTVASNYRDVEAIAASDFLMTYTCNVVPSENEQRALRDYIALGGRWLALHGTNAILEFVAEGVNSPETAPILMQTLGTQFIAHPPIAPFRVRLADPSHELVAGVASFETDDELYLCRIHGELHVLLDAEFSGEATGFIEAQWDDDAPRPVYYLHTVGQGEVLYLNLGHCRGHYDMRPLMDFYPKIERGSWAKPEYYELLRRAIRYCVERA